MNILFIADELSYRGTPRFLFVCARVAKAAGHKVLVWGLREGGYTVTLCQENGIALERHFADNGFETHYPQQEIYKQLAAVRGGLPSRFERFKMHLAYSLPNALRIHLLNLRK